MVAQNNSLAARSFNLFFLGLEEIMGPEDLDKLIKDTPDLISVSTTLTVRQVQSVKQRMTELYSQTGAR